MPRPMTTGATALLSLLLALVLCLATAFPVAAAKRSKHTPAPRRRYDEARLQQLRQKVTENFQHGYEAYMQHAFPQDELKPLTCQGSNSFGGYALTLIDSLDMLALIGDDEEFFKQARWVAAHIRFDSDLRVSVFETTIRVLGGLLSAHLLALDLAERHRALGSDPAVFGYDGHGLLDAAKVVGEKMMDAFDTPTGIPFNEIHLRNGVDKALGHTNCPAAAGSLVLEFGLLTQLTGDCRYIAAAKNAMAGVWKHRAATNLVGTLLDIFSGQWTNKEANIGASVDSFYEYMFKAFILFDDGDYHDMWLTAYKAAQKYMYFGGWYLSSTVDHAGPIPSFEHRINSLQAFWPGLQVLAGDVPNALDSYAKMLCIVRDYNFMPEYMHLSAYLSSEGHTKRTGAGYPLRPEFVESTLYLHRATGDSRFLEIAEDFLNALVRLTRVRCGFAAVDDIFKGSKEDKMDSFMLAETLKYLYLIFTPSNAPQSSPLSRTVLGGGRVPYHLDTDYVFTTEAHPVRITPALMAAAKRCNKLPITMPGNDRRMMAKGYVAVGPNAVEEHPPTAADRRRQCPVVDYMRDVAPFMDAMYGPRAEQYCRLPVYATVLTGSTQFPKIDRAPSDIMNPRPRGAAPASPAQDSAGVSGAEAKPTGGLHVNESPKKGVLIPADPTVLFSRDLHLFFDTEKAAAPAVRMVNGMAVLPRRIFSEDHLFLGGQNLFLQASLPDREPHGLFVSTANFGPAPCEDEGGEAYGPLLASESDLCPNVAGSLAVPALDAVADLPRGELRNNVTGGASFGLLVKRGGCTFKEKAWLAQQVGASYVVVGNTEDSLLVMADADIGVEEDIKIPVVMVDQTDAGNLRRHALKQARRGRSLRAGLQCVTKARQQMGSIGIALVQRGEHVVLLRRRHAQRAGLPLTSLLDEEDAAARAVPPSARGFVYRPETACTTCTLVVSVAPVGGTRGPLEADAVDRLFRALPDTVAAMATATATNPDLKTMHQVSLVASVDGSARHHPAAKDHHALSLTNVHALHRTQAGTWGVVEVTTFALLPQASAASHVQLQDTVERYYENGGMAQSGVLARYFGFAQESQRYVEVLVFASLEAGRSFHEPYDPGLEYTDGQLLQWRQLLYRDPDTVSTQLFPDVRRVHLR